MKTLYNQKGGKLDSGMGLSVALGAIFIIGIGIGVTNSVVSEQNLTGLTGLVVGYSPLVIGAGFLYLVAKTTGMLKD